MAWSLEPGEDLDRSQRVAGARASCRYEPEDQFRDRPRVGRVKSAEEMDVSSCLRAWCGPAAWWWMPSTP